MLFAHPPGVRPLGMIPDWQYSSDPAVNIKINPFVAIPADWPNGQRTIQPRGWLPDKAKGDPLAGLGITMAKWQAPPSGLGFVDSWAWRNRKWLILGGGGLLALAALGGVGALLR